MIEWNKNAENEKFEEEHYSNLKKQNGNMLAEKSKIPFIIIGAGILCLIVIFFVLNPKPPQNQVQDNRLIDNRLAKIEARLDQLEALKDQMKNIEDQVRLNSDSQAISKDIADMVKVNAGAIEDIEKKLSMIDKGALKSQKVIAPASTPKAEAPQKAAPPKQSGGEKLYHTVKKGETLYRISQKYGISVKQLQEMNGIDAKTLIHPGQKLVVGPVGKQ